MDSAEKVDADLIRGAFLIGFAICVCVLLAFAALGFYNLFEAEMFPWINPALNTVIKGFICAASVYLGLIAIGKRGLEAINNSIRGRDIMEMFSLH